MVKPHDETTEQGRLSALFALKILDTPPEERYDRLTRKLAQLLEVPIAYLALIGAERQWLKSVVGPMSAEMERTLSFCTHTICDDGPLIVPDARLDSRFAENPLVVGEPHVRFYAGVPLTSADGHNVGTLCIADTKPRDLSSTDLEILKSYAALFEEKINSTPKVFISYSHEDEAWKDRLVNHLSVLERQGLLDLWDDRRIDAGGAWRNEIQEAIESASVAILLVSANFLTSNFIMGEEIPRLLHRRDKEGLEIVPLLIKPCCWKKVECLAQMNFYPKDARPLSSFDDHQIDHYLAEVAPIILEKITGPCLSPPPPARQPVRIAAEPSVVASRPEAARPISGHLLRAGLVVIAILSLVLGGIVGGVLDKPESTMASTGVQRDTVPASLATEIAGKGAQTEPTIQDSLESPALEEKTQPPESAAPRPRQQPTANEPSRTAEQPPEAPAQADPPSEVAARQTQEPDAQAGVEQEPTETKQPAPSEDNPIPPEIPHQTPLPEPEPVWDEQQAKRDIAGLVERYRQRYEAGDVAGLKAMGLSVEGLTPFFKDAAERKITADPSIKFSGEETARVSVAVRVSCKIGGESRDYPFKRLWEVVYHDGHWKILHDNNAN